MAERRDLGFGPHGEGLAITVEPFRGPSPAMRSAIAAAAEQIGDAQGLSTTVHYGRVFAEKRPKLRIDPSDA